VALLAGQNQQLRVASEHFADGILKFTSRLDPLLDFLDPLFGDALSVSFPPPMKTSDHAAWPLPLAQWQEGFPQRV
jgi:hypothetical protein